MPTVSVSPETGVKAGIFIDYFYKTKGSDSQRVRPSISWAQVLYSTRKQFTAELFTSTYTSREKYYVYFKGGFVSEYERFWGYTKGNRNNKDYAEVTYNRVYASPKATRNLGKRIFAGLNFYYSDFSRIKFGNNAASDSSLKVSESPSRIAGYGLSFTIDRRDNQFSPVKGMYLDASVGFNHQLLTSRYAYTLFNFDIRNYKSGRRFTWANQLLFTLADREMPLLEKPRLGGSNLMRGMFMGRFRDNNLWALQTEGRIRLSRFLKLAVFSSVGSTSPNAGELFAYRLQYTGGTGLRLLINKEKQIYLRADVAFSAAGSWGYYFRIGDAF